MLFMSVVHVGVQPTRPDGVKDFLGCRGVFLDPLCPAVIVSHSWREHQPVPRTLWALLACPSQQAQEMAVLHPHGTDEEPGPS